MCFRRSPSDKPTPSALPPRSPCVLATRLPVWWDDVYNNGERQSNFTQHARQGSHLSARPPRHIWKEMRLKTTLTSCTGRRAKEGGGSGAEACHTRASDAISPWQGACQNEEISHFVASPLFPTFWRSSPELYLPPSGLSVTRASAMKSTCRRPNGLLCVATSYLVWPKEDGVIPPDPPGVMGVFPLTHCECIWPNMH